jgi:hypothetical protein
MAAKENQSPADAFSGFRKLRNQRRSPMVDPRRTRQYRAMINNVFD